MPETESERAQGGAYPGELDNRRPSGTDGQPPRSATEPPGSEAADRPPDKASDKRTAREITTDPTTGEPLNEG